jgi:hypothetical protein
MASGKLIGCLWLMLTGLIIFETVVTVQVVKSWVSVKFDDYINDVIKQRGYVLNVKEEEAHEINIISTPTPEPTPRQCPCVYNGYQYPQRCCDECGNLNYTASDCNMRFRQQRPAR